MAAAPVATEVHQALDVHGHVAPLVALHHVVGLDDGAQAVDVVAAQVIAVHLVGQIRLVQNLAGRGKADAVDVGQGPVHVLVARQIHAC